jgi:hypothetical protein
LSSPLIRCPHPHEQVVETRRLSMDEELHQCILVAVHSVGVKHSSPTSILLNMRRQRYDARSSDDVKDAAFVKGLSTEHIK